MASELLESTGYEQYERSNSVSNSLSSSRPLVHNWSKGGNSVSTPERPESSFILFQSSKHCLQFPDYSDEATRLESFKYWGGVVPAQELAEAGFYMIAPPDVVRCFSCNVIVQEWEENDNAVSKHQMHSKDCTYLNMFVSTRSTNSEFSTLAQKNEVDHSVKATPSLSVQTDCNGSEQFILGNSITNTDSVQCSDGEDLLWVSNAGLPANAW